jgi:ureidoglycolate dehydrogenase (NAD+)
VHTISAEELRNFAAALLSAGGFRTDHAEITADLLVWANLRGIDSHGVLRIPRYVEMAEQGIIVSERDPITLHEFGAIAVLDGGKCPGAVGMSAARDRAGRLARKFGIGWCAIRETSHSGAVGYYTSKLADEGMVGIAMSASKPLMAYYGAKGETLSTNPLSIAVPTRDNAPLILDMSTAAVALGKIMAAKDAGRSIPEGWAIDVDGKPATDPAAVAAVLPMAGAKGSGLSLMIEVLTSILPGNPVIAPALLGRINERMNGAVIALAPEAFGDAEQFAADVAEIVDVIHRLKPLDPEIPVLLPGERSAAERAKRDAHGITLPPGTVARLRALAQRFECEIPTSLAN